MKKITFLVISLMTSASANAQTTPTTNSIYIDQVGDGSTINLTQEGQSNKIGDSETDRFVLDGNQQIVTVKQDGNNNVIKGSVVDAANIVYDTTVTGDNNEITYDQGGSGSVAGSTKTLTVDGNLNALTFNQADAVGAVNAKQIISVDGNSNTYTSTINTNDVDNNVKVIGNENTIAMTQKDGVDGKKVVMLVEGSDNIVTVKQEGQGSDSINIKLGTPTTPNVGSTLIINQCGAPPC